MHTVGLWIRCLHFRSFGEGIVGVAAITLEKCAGFDRQRFVQHIAFDVTCGAKLNFARADAAFHASADHGFFRIDIADDDCFLANHQSGGANVAIDFAVNLHIAGRDQRSLDDQFRADHRRYVSGLGPPGLGRWTGRRRCDFGFLAFRKHCALPLSACFNHGWTEALFTTSPAAISGFLLTGP